MTKYKPDLSVLKQKGVKVAAFMTAPRYEAVWARNVIETSLKNAGIPLVVSGGVFYGQCMERMLAEAMDIGVEIAITVDFDSIFTKDDLLVLLNRLIALDHVDALAALQSRRGTMYPLFTVGKKRKVGFNTAEPLEVTTAHFGLTAIQLDKLAKIPQPWFWSTPDDNGTWLDGKVDDDVYFWQKWREHGNTIYIDGAVSIGHLEEVVALFDGQGKHRFVYPRDWFESNREGMNEADKTDNADNVTSDVKCRQRSLAYRARRDGR